MREGVARGIGEKGKLEYGGIYIYIYILREKYRAERNTAESRIYNLSNVDKDYLLRSSSYGFATLDAQRAKLFGNFSQAIAESGPNWGI